MMCYYDALPIIQHMAKGNNSHKKEVKTKRIVKNDPLHHIYTGSS
jgi:hypothetical protein